MALQYELYKNQLGSNPSGYYARTVNQQIHNRDKLIEMMLNRGSSLAKADIEAALICFEEAIMQIIKDGDGLNTGIFSMHLDIKGTFADANSYFNPSENKIAININASKPLKDLLAEVVLQRVYGSGKESKITSVEDTLSKTTNKTLSEGGPVKVSGYLIKIIATQPSDNKEGLYAVSLSDGSSTKFPTQVRNTPSQLIYLAPSSLPSDDYRLEVRTYGISNKTKSGKTLRVISSDVIFSVS